MVNGRTLITPGMAAREVLWLLRDNHGIAEATHYHIHAAGPQPWRITVCDEDADMGFRPEMLKLSLTDFSRLVCQPVAERLAAKIRKDS